MSMKLYVGKLISRRVINVILLLMLVLSLGIAVPAFTQGLEDDNVFTGCLEQKSGKLSNVAVGLDPVKACDKDEFQITWDYAKPEFENRITILEERVAQLEEPYGVLDLFVDCAAGDTIGAALDSAQTHLGPVNIIIYGVCEETVRIERDNVSFTGVNASDGIQGPTAGFNSAVELHFAHRVQLSNMTISGGEQAISADGSSFTASNITILNSIENGIMAERGSTGFIRDCFISGHPRSGVSATSESVIDMGNCEIIDNDKGISVSGSTIKISNSEITGNNKGAMAQFGGYLEIWDTLIANNEFSGVSSSGGNLFVSGDTIITGSIYGVMIGRGSSAGISGSVIVENNQDTGISAFEGSTILASDVIVRNNGSGFSAGDLSTLSIWSSQIIGNHSDGISVWDLSTVHVWSTTQIIDNGGWGIRCEGPPAIAVLGGQGNFDPDEIVFSGNTSGDTNCQ